LVALILVAVVIGAGVYAYSAGVAQGVAAGGEGAAAVPYAGPIYYPRFGFGLLFCLPLLLLFFLFPLFGGRRRRGMWGHDRGRWGDKVPPMVEEWHRHMHGQPTETGPQSRPAKE
jgi:hypothetical protein